MSFKSALQALKRIDNAQGTPVIPELSAPARSLAIAELAAADTVIVGYGRRSNKKDGSDSEDRQKRDIGAACRSMFGRGLNAFHFDGGRSGRVDQLRLAFNQLKRDIAAGNVNIVIVEHPDRIARSAAHLTAFKRLCDSQGVKIISLHKRGEILGLEAAIMGHMSEEQAAAMLDRNMKGRVKAAASRPMYLPFGYIKVGKEWFIDESRREIIEYIFSSARAGMDLNTIARVVNARLAMMRDNKAPHVGFYTIKRWLQNLKYTGIFNYGKTKRRLNVYTEEIDFEDVPEEQWTYLEVSRLAIIDRETMYAVLGSNSKPKRPRKLTRPHALVPSTMPVCAHCGGGMKSFKLPDRGRGISYQLRCSNRDCLANKGFPLAQVEDLVLEAVRSVLDRTELEDEFVADLQSQEQSISAQLAKDRANLEKRRKQLEAEIQMLMKVALARALKDQAEREAALSGASPAADSPDSDDVWGQFTVPQLKLQISATTEGLKGVELELASLRPEPGRIDPGGRSRILAAYEKIVSARRDGGLMCTQQATYLRDSETAIANIVETIKLGVVHPGAVAKYEIVVRLDAIFGDGVADVRDPRTSFVSVVHPGVIPMQVKRRGLSEEMSAYEQRIFAATDDQFVAVEQAMSTDVRARLASIPFAPRDFIDLLFLMTRASLNADFARGLLPGKWVALDGALRQSVADGTWENIFAIIEEQFPELFRLMNTVGYPESLKRRDAFRLKTNAVLRSRRAAGTLRLATPRKPGRPKRATA